MSEFRVDISRPLKPQRLIKGLPVVEDSGLNYVDVYFPDGSQMTWGYIGRNPQPGDYFTVLAGCKQAVADAIQAEIDRMLGTAERPYHEIIVEEDEPEEDDDE